MSEKGYPPGATTIARTHILSYKPMLHTRNAPKTQESPLSRAFLLLFVQCFLCLMLWCYSAAVSAAASTSASAG
ncbi:MAG: hypothetical protein UEP80_08690, partial [Senegalimassilia anaerobia]|nr:hypothetical protein [Senegalimassilia anaerobia]